MRQIEVINYCNCLGKKNSKGLVFFIALPRRSKKSHSAEPQPATQATLTSKGQRRFACRKDRDPVLTT